MIITYYGAYCVKAQSGNTILAFNPPSKKSSFKSPRFQADVVLVSVRDKDFDGFEQISPKGDTGAPFLVDAPGEYEVGGVVIEGLASSKNHNTVFVASLENIRLCHLGVLGEKELASDIRELLGEIDVLFVSAETPANVINQIDARIVIPLYADSKQLNGFLKDFGSEKIQPLDKFSFKKKDMADKKMEIVVLKPTIN